MKNFIKPGLLFIIIISFNVIATAQVSGTVFRDFNGNGVKDNTTPMFEPFVQGITVKAFNAANVQLGTTKTTDAVGAYSFSVAEIPAATAVRIEFSGLGTGDYSSFNGTGNSTNIQFVTAPNAAVSFAVNAPDDYWNNITESNPVLVVGQNKRGRADGFYAGGASIVQLNNNTQSTSPPANSSVITIDTGQTVAARRGSLYSQTGSVYGLALQQKSQRSFMTASIKRGSGFGPQGPGGIYIASKGATYLAYSGSFTLQGVTPSNGGGALDFGSVTRVLAANPAAPTAGELADNNYLSSSSAWTLGAGSDSRDNDAFAKAGTMSYGDIEADKATDKLYTINLFQKKLIVLDVENTATATLNNALPATLTPFVRAYDLTGLTGWPTATGAGNNLRPCAVKVYRGVGYIGVVSDAMSTQLRSDLRGYILSFDPNNIAAGLTTVLTINFSNYSLNYMGPWVTTWAQAMAQTGAGAPGPATYPQPMISSLEFNENGSMDIGIRDRWGDQGSSFEYTAINNSPDHQQTVTQGDVLHACKTAGGWALEGTAGSCDQPAGNTNGGTATNNFGAGYSYQSTTREWYSDKSGDGLSEIGEAGMTKLMGTERLVTTVYDPMAAGGTPGSIYWSTQGVLWSNVTTGAKTQWARTDGNSSVDKSNGMGDLEFLISPQPVQIGNRIWNDANSNGIQDAGEAGINGVALDLVSPGPDGIFGNGDDVVLASTTSATINGQVGSYFFSALTTQDARKPATWAGVTNIVPGLNYQIRIANATGASQQAVLAGLQPSVANVAANTFESIDNDAILVGVNALAIFNTNNTNHNIDIGFKPLASLGDKIWRDDNKNATQDAGEPGVSGVVITLFRPGFGLDGIALTADDALPIANTVTDSYGNYLFDNLVAGSYQVQVNLPANYQFTTQSNTVDNTDGTATKDKGSDVNATTGLSYSITLTAGENERNIDAGIIFNQPASVSSIGDRVWYDTNGNGTQDAGEPGVSNVTVTLYKETAPGSGIYVPYATTVTDANGNYLFNNLPNNTNYKVGITAPAGTLLTTSTGTTAGNGTTDSDLDPTTRLSAVVNIPPAGAQITGIDVGLILQPTTKASLGDRVWYDNNRDGDQDAGEPGIAGVTVQLLDANSIVLQTTTTDAFGNYIFTNLNPGVYRVNFGAVAGMQRTSLNSTGGTIADITDSDADPTTGRTQGYTLNAGGKNMSVDAGYYSTQPAANVGAIGDRVWVDNDGNGVQDAGEPSVAGVTVTLYDNVGAVIATATTDINGNYLFPGLTPGNYTVGFSNIPAGFGFTGQDKGGNDATDSDENPATGRTQSVTVSGGNTITTVDAGIRQGLPSGLGSLGNKVFYDLAGGTTGQQDAGELGVAGVTVQLYFDTNGDGTITGAEQTAIATTTTNALGEYLFAGLNAGNYQVGFSNLPAGYTLTVKDAAGISDDEDSDGNAVNTAVNGNPAAAGKSYTDLISLAQGEDNLSVDLGLVTPASTNTLGNYVWFDANSDGIQDATENGVPGVMVTLYNNGGTAIAVTTTDAGGQYLFTGLADGNYSVGFNNYPAGFDFTVKSASNDLTGSDADRISGRTATVTLNFAAGGTSRDNRSLDAGLVTTRAALGDKVWSDLNNNGTQDAGEYGIAGVTVSLYRPGFGLDGIAGNADDALAVASMITDGKGNYFFSNLIPGDYQLEFTTIPNGMLFTQQNTPGDNQNNTNSDAIPGNANGRTTNINLSAGETDLTVDAGLTVPRPATIGNRVWSDFDADGIQDANEPGLGGILVTLYNSINQPIGSAVTDGNGMWQITNIPSGNGYYVIFSPNLPAFNTTATPGTNPAWTTQNLGANGAGALDSGTESDLDSDVTSTGANAGRTAAFNIVPGNNFPNIDAGIINWSRGNTLPIQLISFTAQPQGNNVQLNWVVATETNVATYQVLYSTNGTNFSSIASQPATGNRNYNQLHTAPQPGLNYYRLKIIDIDGAISYSEIRKVNFGKGQDNISLYPIPANTSLNITFSTGMINKPATISILSFDGKLMLQQNIPALSQTETINVSRLASGKYIVTIAVNNETINRQIEVIK